MFDALSRHSRHIWDKPTQPINSSYKANQPGVSVPIDLQFFSDQSVGMGTELLISMGTCINHLPPGPFPALISCLVLWIRLKISLNRALYSGWLCSSLRSTASSCSVSTLSGSTSSAGRSLLELSRDTGRDVCTPVWQRLSSCRLHLANSSS